LGFGVGFSTFRDALAGMPALPGAQFLFA